jgi:hypothetical protein
MTEVVADHSGLAIWGVGIGSLDTEIVDSNPA